MSITRLLIAVGLAVGGTALAQTAPDRITFSARLTDTAGVPVTGSHAVIYSLFNVGTGGTSVWTESYPTTNFTADGLAFAELGTNLPLTSTILDGSKLYLEISVDGTAMSPRVGIVSVAYAIRASEAAKVGGFTAAQLQQKVSNSCSAGSAIRVINTDGTVTCEAVAGGSSGIASITTASGSGLVGGVTTGTANLSLAACTNGQVLKSSGSAWACAADTDTTYTAPAAGGLALTSSALSLGNCPVNQIFKSTGTNTWACAVDNGGVTGVTATAPLVSSGGTAPNLTITQASASAPGFLSATDWSSFDSRRTVGGRNMIEYTNVASKWVLFLGGVTPAVSIDSTDSIEGDASFQFDVSALSQGPYEAYGDFIAVDPNRSYTGRIYAKLTAGAGPFYAGVQAYGGNKAPLGQRFFITSNTTLVNGVWTEFSGAITGIGGGTNQFPANTRFIKPLIIPNYNNIGITKVDGLEIYVDSDYARRLARFSVVNSQDGQDNGVLVGRNPLLVKHANDTGVRVAWNDNFRVLGTNTACRWEILFNNASCASPGPITFDKYEGNTGSNRHDLASVFGTCFGLAAGNVQITTRVGPSPGYAVTDCATGWQGQYVSVEAEEVR